MHSNALATAITLYRSGTLTLSQAATHSGYSEEDLRVALQRHGVSVREEDAPVAATSTDHSASAD
ncbi:MULTISPECIES: UPF0175 family protein [Haloferax]|uniref:Uncharacterized protein n=2 Tax=Haloferax TaxID=2251 RepID=A0A6G1YZS3_9EURY|nr:MULTISPECIES: UPF0175 family protein [Haloferax]KAB1187052.1 hypothetical protein Hfx1149_03005 [Haloferax sp. CBA1149]MRW79688.1 hypothetical protein [Haloferax marinisediminis]